MSNKNMISRNRKKIVWAIDAFAEVDLQERGSKFIKQFSGYMDNDIEPVFVLSRENIRVRPDYFSVWIDSYISSAENILKKIVQKCCIKRLITPKILLNNGSKRDAVDTLLKYCQQQKAEAIVVSSHSEEGFVRFFHRSFAEKLLLRSSIPIVVLNPVADVNTVISHIVFPTDFKEESFADFETVLLLAKSYQAALTIYCKMQVPLYLTSENSPYFHIYFEEEVKQRKELAKKWVEKAKEQGVDCNFEINENIFSGKIGDAIIKYTNSVHADMIFMVSKTSPVGAFFGNSISRYIARNALCPVCVVHGQTANQPLIAS